MGKTAIEASQKEKMKYFKKYVALGY